MGSRLSPKCRPLVSPCLLSFSVPVGEECPTRLSPFNHHISPKHNHTSVMAVSRLFRQNNGSAVVFLGVGIVPLLIALGLILAAPHSAFAAPCDPQVSGWGPTTS